ncbi:hypothetical protein [Pandoraea oxalativorans]|uniref:hypothetical protein n=1 Tax=Pandoraea oxalativorans TaxID=573737 RepID=UPI000696CA2B|nr:hypothetical protein [Pandoraea oxalativorans]
MTIAYATNSPKQTLSSGAALATVVGVLVEVPLMLVVVRVVNRSKHWYERASPDTSCAAASGKPE